MTPNILTDLSIKISQYFLEFLESDFKRQQAPRRRIILQTDNGFKAGMRIAPYVELQKTIWDLLETPINQELKFVFKPKAFNKQLSNALKLVIKEQVETISQSSVDAVKTELVNQSKATLGESLKSPEGWIESLQLVLMNEISTQIVRPMLSLVDEALSKQAYSQVDSIFNAEIDLVNRLAQPLDEVLTEILARYAATHDNKELKAVADERFNIDFIKKSLIEYFEIFASADAFLEFRDIETYATTAEGIQLYLYVGTMKYGASTYPMFYIPLECGYDESAGGFKLSISSHVFANKRAFDFILQELGERQARQWMSPIKERITYVSAEDTIESVIAPLVVRIQEAFGLLEPFSMSDGPIQQVGDTNVTINNALHICAFEKSDEALLNDYEEMISQARNNEQGVISLFEGIVGGVLLTNPSSIESAIDKEWDGLSVDQRVVPDSPIPLNEEQVKIINAIGHPEGKFIVVEGPPGTGKSHTIVAIAADCAFKNKSCLILSDKKEALEVVQKKLSKTMNDVRGDEEFPNPLLRLGTEQANFRKLTSQQVLTQVQAHAKATQASQSKVSTERDSKRNLLKNHISQTIDIYSKVKTSDIAEVQSLAINLNELTGQDLSGFLDELLDANPELKLDAAIADSETLKSQLVEIYESKRFIELRPLLAEFRARAFSADVHEKFDKNVAGFCSSIQKENVNNLSNLLAEYQAMRMPLFGYLFRGSQVAALNTKAQQLATFSKQIDFKKDGQLIQNLLSQSRALISWIDELGEPQVSFELAYSHLAKKHPQSRAFKDFYALIKVLEPMHNAMSDGVYIKPSNAHHFCEAWVGSVRYLHKFKLIRSQFSSAPSFDYVGRKTEVEKLNTSLMNNEVDSRLINFMQNSKADAKVLAQLIKDKQKFPEEKFNSVKEAFPVIVASIREFGEFMPLKSDIFDVLVIDEASQVSVAQAFPALLRAKKVVVMGDSKQFSNTKSTNASIALNDKYRSDLQSYFKREVSMDAAMLQRLSYFDVKRSILEFSQMCSNYSIMLRKHFRSYQELISYSSKTFYGGQLQAIKIRGVPLSEVIEFTELDGDIVSTRSTNQTEADFIVERCVELLEEDNPPSVGIITPYTDQQTLLSKCFSNHPLYQEFKSKLKLKIMTFDSCQGEERSIIFYSMVATKDSDTLNYVFPVSLDDAQELVESKLKIQRLNVGFSRAQEMIWFVMSKPIDEFKGSIGQALRHYKLILDAQKPTHQDTDPLSPMENKVLDWLHASEFYQLYEEELEVLPQFPIGDYLKQLDPTYKHPAYKVDFLLTYTSEKGIVHIVIEYDGFEYHFKKDMEIDAGNHERYLTDSDIERQLTLESYGYKFIRINRFNLGKDPIKTLSDRLFRMVDAHFQDNTNEVVKSLQSQASSLLNKTAKQCPICKQIKEHKEYFDPKLKDGNGGYGRNCLSCKEEASKTKSTSERSAPKRYRKRRWR
jgi:hypothetical protein